jgi:sugar lactone lactonase YvrE
LLVKLNAVKCALALGLLLTCAVHAQANDGAGTELPDPPEWQCLYVGGWGTGNVYRVAADGTTSVYADDIPNPDQMVFDADGALYVAGGDGIYKVTPTEDGSTATLENGHVQLIATGIERIRPLALDREGNFWAAEYRGENARLYKVTPQGEKTVVDDTLIWPYGLAAGPDGDMYLAELGHGFRVHRYTLDGKRTLVGRGPHWTRNLAFDSDGNLYVLGGWNIVKMARDGTTAPVTVWKDSGDEVHHPVGLAFDANDTLYFTSRKPKNQKDALGFVYKVGADGSRTVFARVGSSPFYLAFWPKTKPE